jgi:two-component system response regulator DesR
MSLLRTALAAVLSAEDDLEVVAQLATLDELTAEGPAMLPDVAVVDLDQVSLDEAGALTTVGTALPGCAVLALARRDPSGRLRRALSYGVPALVDKDTAPRQLVQYIRQVARGERVVDPRLAAAAVSAARNPLTPRERDVLRAAAAGLPSSEIAASLRLTAGTVRNYLSSIIRKTGTRNRVEAVRIAEKAGWL